MEKAVKITLIISLAVLILVFGGIYLIKGFYSSENTVTASGEAVVKVLPDVTSVYFSIETNNASAEKAKDENNLLYNKVKQSLLIAGIKEEDIGTEQFSVNENWEWDGEKSTRNGFIAQHYLKINLIDREKIGKVIDAVIDNKARINSINFELSKEKENFYKAEALKKATEDARTKAEAIASGLNKRVGSLMSVETSEFNYVPWAVYRDSSVVEKAQIEREVSINPSEREVNAGVSVVYKLK